ncbi:P-loop containing nucleoside triphosphate hydrolase protein [Punctularia strigosozonata HHB-11173 SS5]|uniref:P-loop containing nucleoside triphosphate hydrolase protein n=1 Tax=Punctularia strigosozonata (strain HHB-11173) TaxID=741275 RepID=UPI0004416301|nr:P-loop containing nucleoside triphosphate hydrolase protein [Punctularia strigosozonata HHB-11173 SS5]EIN14067.1 P-loop containing nucleoside triphosphate hydrolase protein [Punctularia strigosozonata HHB-11173 SS5]
MAPPKKSVNPSGLGHAIMNRRVKDNRHAQESGFYTTDVDATNRLKSVTQERDLDEFLSTATLAGTDFTAERRNIKIVSSQSPIARNPYLLSEDEERATLQKFQENRQRLRVPRRPPWKKGMPTVELDRQEKNAFLEWRRGLADLQDRDRFLLTPFERNLEVWRQLWRVIERAHLVVQIVDARNPLRFRCEDLESYVTDIEGAEGEKDSGPRGLRRNLLLINKSDLLTAKQRRLWADYFDSLGVRYAFFSAANAAALQQARRDALAAQEAADRTDSDTDEGDAVHSVSELSASNSDAGSSSDISQTSSPSSAYSLSKQEQERDNTPGVADNADDSDDPRARVLTVLELEELFVRSAPDLQAFATSSSECPQQLVVGLVGYPNVGKSSTINALLGEKKVSVSATPGKTKHFQTIQLSPSVMLCDCPGLVFPQFATTRADLVCDGVLPIDQLREYTAPTALVVKRIPRDVLEATYGLTIRSSGPEEGGDSSLRGEDLLVPYAVARGFARSGQGNPDEARAARYILKDYVNARLLFCHPPPGYSSEEFNADMHAMALLRAVGKKRAPTTRVTKGADTFIPVDQSAPDGSGQVPHSTNAGHKSNVLDQDFFATRPAMSSRAFVQGTARHGKEFSRTQLYPHQNMVADDGQPLTGRRARIASVLASAGADNGAPLGKRHKKPKRVKQRSGKGYD